MEHRRAVVRLRGERARHAHRLGALLEDAESRRVRRDGAHDDAAWLSVRKRSPLLVDSPTSKAARNLERIGNILKKAEGEVQAKVDAALLQEAAEQQLAAALAEVQPQADRLFELHDYTASLQALAVLKAPVDAFFDAVMVNAEDPALRANRLGLLKTLHEAMNRVADLARLAA